MKVGITSDVHLKGRPETPERYNALEYIFQDLVKNNVNNLIIAGDLFDRDFDNYLDFDKLCNRFPDIKVTIIPGNHDQQIDRRFFTSQNITIFTEPSIKTFGDLSFLFIPYDPTKSMDEVLAEFFHGNRLPARWVLVGHGDYMLTNRTLNPYEPGFYMPISANVINRYNPSKVILGHIHKPTESGRVIYPGSPCGLDINETGKRRYLILDTDTLVIDYRSIETDVIYQVETLQVFPFENELDFVQDKIEEIIGQWGLTDDELKKVKLRLHVKGYTHDLNSVVGRIKEIVTRRGIKFYDGEPNLSELRTLKEVDDERLTVLEKLEEKIGSLNDGDIISSKDEVLYEAMKIVFGSEK